MEYSENVIRNTYELEAQYGGSWLKQFHSIADAVIGKIERSEIGFT
jgi:hypothetical protein